MLSPSFVNELRYGMMYTNEPRFGPQNGTSLVSQLGLMGLLPNIPNLPGIPNISFSGLVLQAITQTAYGLPDFQNFNQYIQRQTTWTRGKHTVRAGTQIARYAANNVVQSNSLFGSLSFSNRYTGLPISCSDILVRPALQRPRLTHPSFVGLTISS